MFGSKLDILKKQWIDVVFTGRNKAYGAYELRTNSPKNTNRALIFGIVVFVFVLSLKTIINAIDGFIPKAPEKISITQVKLLPPPPPPANKKPPPPPPEPPKPRVTQVKFPPPVVKPDVEVKDNPPTQKELQTADPGQKDQKGDPNADINIDGPVGNSDQKVTESDPNQIFAAVEQEPMYPGGINKFYSDLQKILVYPAVDRENNVQGKVMLTFVVEKDGSLTDIKALRSPSETLTDAATKALLSLKKWKPGIQNARPVRVQFTVPISFNLGEDQ